MPLLLLSLALPGLSFPTAAQGTRVPVLHRWLEEIDNEDTWQWVQRQNADTRRHLE